MRTCANADCGKSLYRTMGERPQQFEGRRFCDDACRTAARHPNEKICRGCGKVIRRRIGTASSKWARRQFCHGSCRSGYFSKREEHTATLRKLHSEMARRRAAELEMLALRSQSDVWVGAKFEDVDRLTLAREKWSREFCLMGSRTPVFSGSGSSAAWAAFGA